MHIVSYFIMLDYIILIRCSEDFDADVLRSFLDDRFCGTFWSKTYKFTIERETWFVFNVAPTGFVDVLTQLIAALRSLC